MRTVHFLHEIHTYSDIPNPSNFSGFWGAFAGAFFAFIFGLLAYRLTKRWELFVQHKNSLVKLDRLFNRHLDQLVMLESLVKNSYSILEGDKLTFNRLFELKIPENLDMEIGSIELINKFFSYQASIDRLNFNIKSINQASTRFEEIVIAHKSLDPVDLKPSIELLKYLEQEFVKTANKIKEYLVVVRIHLNKTQQINFINFLFSGLSKATWDFKISKEEIRVETLKLEEEIKEVQAQENKS